MVTFRLLSLSTPLPSLSSLHRVEVTLADGGVLRLSPDLAGTGAPTHTQPPPPWHPTPRETCTPSSGTPGALGEQKAPGRASLPQEGGSDLGPKGRVRSTTSHWERGRGRGPCRNTSWGGRGCRDRGEEPSSPFRPRRGTPQTGAWPGPPTPGPGNVAAPARRAVHVRDTWALKASCAEECKARP